MLTVSLLAAAVQMEPGLAVAETLVRQILMHLLMQLQGQRQGDSGLVLHADDQGYLALPPSAGSC